MPNCTDCTPSNDRLNLDEAGDEGMEDENPSIFQSIQSRRRQKMRHITTVRDSIGGIYKVTAEIMQAFTEHLKSSFTRYQHTLAVWIT
jgi:hypothetical protein